MATLPDDPPSGALRVWLAESGLGQPGIEAGRGMGVAAGSALALGVEGDYTLIPGAVHGIALRAHWGRPVPLPRADAWAQLVSDELARFQASTA